MSTRIEKNTGLTQDDIIFLVNKLRQASVTWSGRTEALKLARRKVFVRTAKNGRPVTKYTWQCAICSKWFWDAKAMEVDHIVEIGGVTGFTGSWDELIGKMFPRPVEKHLQVVCGPCHLKKTASYMNASARYKRKRAPEPPDARQEKSEHDL